jgi:hypothetical protein
MMTKHDDFLCNNGIAYNYRELFLASNFHESQQLSGYLQENLSQALAALLFLAKGFLGARNDISNIHADNTGLN